MSSGRSRKGSSSRSSMRSDEETESSDSQETQQQNEEQEADDTPPTDATGKLILDPKSYWFPQKKITKACTESTKSSYTSGYTCWSSIPDDLKEQWFNIFRNSCTWNPVLEHLVRAKYEKTCQKRFKDNMWKAVKRKKKPAFMNDVAFNDLLKLRDTPEFQRKSKQAALNIRGGDPNARVEPSYFRGSQSCLDRAQELEKANKGQAATAFDIFLDTHAKKDEEGRLHFARKKDSDKYEAYMKRVEEEPGTKPDQIWLEVNEGFKKGAVYGVGNAAEYIYEKRNRRLSTVSDSMYTPGIVRKLEDRVANQDERLSAQDEELRLMREQLQRMQTYFEQCNPGIGPQFPDPRDPHGGGPSSGASVGFQV